MKKWVFGDVHGEFNKLKEVFELAPIQEGDRIICLGDIVDRGEYTYECIEFLLEMNRKYEMIYIRGNHDDAFTIGLKEGKFSLWKQGQRETVKSYIRALKLDREIDDKKSGYTTDFIVEDVPPRHHQFFSKMLPYYIDEDLNLFVHGGFNRHELIENQQPEDIYWCDRDLLGSARSYSSMKESTYKFKIKGCEKGKFKDIFIGHTPTPYFGETKPMLFVNIWDLDTGCGKGDFPLTIMNVDTKEYYQSKFRNDEYISNK